MIRLLSVRSAILSLAILALVAVLMVSSTALDAQSVQPASLIRSRGDVVFMKAGTSRWVPASERMRIGQGDKLKTGANGRAVVRLTPGNNVSLSENTEMVFEQATSQTRVDPDNKVLGLFPVRISEYNLRTNLKQGQAVNVLRNLKGNSTYELHTPVAVVGVRGTIFLATVSPAGTVNFYTSEGVVVVTPVVPGAFEPQELGPGEGFTITVNGGEPFSSLSPEVQAEITQALETVSKIEDQEGDNAPPPETTEQIIHFENTQIEIQQTYYN